MDSWYLQEGKSGITRNMQQIIDQLLSNHILVAAVVGWASAQIIKTVIHLIVYREWKMERLVGSGGMPSSHAATVCAMTVSALMRHGLASPIFALTFILMVVVLHDARGVRWETGKQAKMITAITNFIEKSYNEDVFPEMELKELVGHTPLQVLVGAVLGIVIGLIVG